MQTMNLPYDGIVQVYDGDNIEEAATVIVEECLKAETITKGKKEPKVWYNVAASFDIETTKLRNKYYLDDMPNKYMYFNIVFCWQFAIGDKFIFGRYIDNYFKIMEVVSEILPGYLTVFIHNLPYEYNNLADYFHSSEEMFFKNRSTPLYIRQGKIEYRCTAQMTHKALQQIGEDIHYDKLKDDFNYTLQRSPETKLTLKEINYCYRDVMIINKYIENETKSYCSRKCKQTAPCLLPYTQTGYVRRDVKQNFSKTPIGRAILEQCKLTMDDFMAIRPAFWGGYTHGNFRHIGCIFAAIRHLDITSAYPWALVTQFFPYTLTKAKILDSTLYLSNLKRENYAQIARLKMVGVRLKKGCVPYIPYSRGSSKAIAINDVSENGKLVFAAALELTVCDVDARLIFENYDIDNFEVVDLYYGIKKRLPYNLISIILDYFYDKTTLKGVEGMEYDYALSKQLLNAIYGLSASSPLHESYIVNDNLECIATEVEYDEDTALPYQWAIYTTAYVRNVIYGCISSMTDKKKYIYSDTDSLFYVPNAETDKWVEEYNKRVKNELTELQKKYFNITPKNPKGETQYLGTLLEEHDDCVEFCTIGAKRYYIKHSDGTYDITFSGLRATKTWKDDKKVRHNGYNTDRLIKIGKGSLHKAFLMIKESDVSLEYVEDIDKLSNYNVRGNFCGELEGKEYHRPCSYTLYGQNTTVSLNTDLKAFLFNEVLYNEVY